MSLCSLVHEGKLCFFNQVCAKCLTRLEQIFSTNLIKIYFSALHPRHWLLRGGSLQLLLQLPGNARNSFAAFAAFFAAFAAFLQLLQLSRSSRGSFCSFSQIPKCFGVPLPMYQLSLAQALTPTWGLEDRTIEYSQSGRIFFSGWLGFEPHTVPNWALVDLRQNRTEID